MVSVAIPDFLKSDKQYWQFHHMDIPDVETRDLVCELAGIRCQVWLLGQERYARVLGHIEQKRRVAWLQERIAKIEDELSRRRYARQQPGTHAKPKLAEGVRL